MSREGTGLVQDIQMFLDEVQQFSRDMRNVDDIKARSFCFAERCEALL